MSNRMERRSFLQPKEMISKKCNFCESDCFSKFACENGFDIVRCSNCGLVMVNPLPTFQYIQDFYSQYHEPDSAAIWGNYMANVYAQALNFIKKFPHGSKVLDVGCGYGQFLVLAKERKFQVFGTELAEEPAGYVEKEYKIPVFHGILEDSSFEDGYFDVITLWFVLEHLMDPRKTILKCFNLLKKGGVLVICVPNIDFRQMLVPFQNFTMLDSFFRKIGIKVGTVKFFHAVDPPAHLYGFNQRSLGFLLGRTGFAKVKFDVPENLNHPTLTSRVIESSLNFIARTIKLFTRSRILISNSIIAIAEK